MGEVDRGAPVYPIGIVQKLTQLSGRQIRYYEQQGLLLPQRTKGNQRLYSQDDVDILLRIKQLLASGLSIEGVHASLAEKPAAEIAGNPTAARSAALPPEPYATAPGAIPGLPAGAKLDSLYPVNNQAALLRMLEARRKADNQDKA